MRYGSITLKSAERVASVHLREQLWPSGPPERKKPALPEDYGELEQADEIFVGVEQNSGPKEAEKIFRNALLPPAFGTRKFGWA